METVTNVATTATNVASTALNTASKMVFGDKTEQQSGPEPTAGETGTKDQPYDAGNDDSGNPGQSSTDTSKQTTTSVPVPSAETSNSGPPDGPGAEIEQKKAGVDTVGGAGIAEPSVNADPASGQSIEQKQQGADKPTEEPKGKEVEAMVAKKGAGEEALIKKDPNDHSGEPLKMHDGTEKGNEAKTEGQAGGDAHGDDKGTGEKWEKTTGLAADGGNFDASKPGAGKEADRLLEKKGVTRDDPSKGPPQDLSGSASESSPAPKEKTKSNPFSKLKEKLHLGKKKDKDSS